MSNTQAIYLSLGEIGSLTAKAVRGSGQSWGLAEEAGQAVIWLSRFGLPGAKAFAGLVSKQDGAAYSDLSISDTQGLWANNAGSLCPLICGTAFRDISPCLANSLHIEMCDVSYPLILLPFIASAARQQSRTLTFGYDDTWISCTQTEIRSSTSIDTLNSARGDDVYIISYSSNGESTLVFPTQKRVQLDKQTFETLSHYAHRTYVPASEASRLAGAGAGLTDND